MSPSRKVITAVGLVVLGAVLAVGVVLLRGQGLDRADKWVTVVGFFVSTVLGVAGVVLGWLTWRQTRKPPSVTSSSGQMVDSVTTRGGVDQVMDVTGNVHFGPPAEPQPAGPVSAPPGPVAPTRPPGGQAVTNVWVDGGIRQVRGVGGDVEVDR